MATSAYLVSLEKGIGIPDHGVILSSYDDCKSLSVEWPELAARLDASLSEQEA
jgi:hypothetical protein